MKMSVKESVMAVRFCLGLLLILSAPAVGSAQSGENVAVIINDNSAVSQRIGEYYAQKRGVPAENIIRIRTSSEETIERTAFGSTIEAAIGNAITQRNLHDRVLYIVLTKGVPLRIAGTPGSNGTAGSVDSELTLLYRRMSGQPAPTGGFVENPYFVRAGDPAAFKPFTHRAHDIYLVSRLDGFTEQDVIALIDRAASPSSDGRIVLDGRDPLLNRTGEGWLENAAKRLNDQGHGPRVLHDATTPPVRSGDAVLGYYSWGSIDPQNRGRKVGLRFAPGAIAASFVPSDSRTFTPPSEGWAPAADPRTLQDESSHRLIGDLIAEGITGVAGHVSEPYMQGMIRPDVVFSAYLAGANLVEAFYLAMPYLSWQTVVIGDPLCAPLRQAMLARAAIEDPVDLETQLPAIFAKRRIARVMQLLKGVPERAATLWVRTGVLLGRGDTAGGRRALEQAVELAPRATQWQFQLASLEEVARDYDAAIARYRQILLQEPNHAAALNNLAYALAVHRNAPAEAHPLAQRAARLAPREPLIADTLGWIEHLLGNGAEALKLTAQAVQGAPDNPEVHFHAAVIHASAGQGEAASSALSEALRLDPAFAQRDDVRDLQRRLAAAASQ
jgi:uncharacterized protein (TIGR03790 family)